MEMPVNHFKRRLLADECQIGLWVGLVDPVAAEIAAGAGFDWLVVDAEHAPTDLRSVLVQLQAIAAYPTQPIVRPVIGDVNLIKQYCDVGAQTILIPMVETAEHARLMVAAVRYPPDGIRGVGVGLARAARWNGIDGYVTSANREMCVLVQVETQRGMANLDEIIATDGVDGVFIGPSDLSASMGLIGQPNHPDVIAAVGGAIERIRAGGKGAGVLTSTAETARNYIDRGATFVGIGTDTMLLATAARQLAASFTDR
jgi:4-hydroxy-2-oxoheptanedioate aldolase